ncbi:MAG: hypothetical protein R3F24_03035 [Gammaproteobacteria bacterium]
MKLLGSSLASGLERIRTTVRLSEINERERLLQNTVNDGTWDFDARNNRVEYSERWKQMMGYSDEELSRTAPDWRRIVMSTTMHACRRVFAITWPEIPKSSRTRTVCGARTVNGAGLPVVPRP